MTIILQIIVIVIVGVAAFFLARSQGARHQAIRRLLLMVFVLTAASSVFAPDLWTSAAHLVGVGRGTDLLLYLLVLVFLAFVASTYRRFRHLEDQNTELARTIAIMQARVPGASTPSPRDRDDAA